MSTVPFLDACGDNAVACDVAGGTVSLLSSRGPLARWSVATTTTPAAAALPAGTAISPPMLLQVLASPARLAVLSGSRVIIVDAATGGAHREIVVSDLERTALLGFTPTGAELVARIGRALSVVDGAGNVRAIPTAMPGTQEIAVFFSDGRRALVGNRNPFASQLLLVDVPEARIIRAWPRDFTSLAVRDERAVIAGPHVIELLDVTRNRAEPIFEMPRGRYVRRIAAGAGVRVIAILDTEGALHVLRRNAQSGAFTHAPRVDVGPEALIDVDGDRVVCRRFAAPRDDAWIVRRLEGLPIATLDDAARVCFCGTASRAGDDGVKASAGANGLGGLGGLGDVAFLRAGALHVVARDGAIRLVEGATELRAIARHPRGVVAIDAGERAHVFDLFAREAA